MKEIAPSDGIFEHVRPLETLDTVTQEITTTITPATGSTIVTEVHSHEHAIRPLGKNTLITVYLLQYIQYTR